MLAVGAAVHFIQRLQLLSAEHTEDVIRRQAGVMKLPAVKLQTDDGKHEDGEE